jgi:hypothetical protein
MGASEPRKLEDGARTAAGTAVIGESPRDLESKAVVLKSNTQTYA